MKPNKFQLLEALEFFHTIGPRATFKFLVKPRRIEITECVPHPVYDAIGGGVGSVEFEEVTSIMDKKTYMLMYRDYKNIIKGVSPINCNLFYVDPPF